MMQRISHPPRDNKHSTIVVDLLNILYNNSNKRATMVNFDLLKAALDARFPGATCYHITDASTRHKVDNLPRYEAILATENVLQAPAGETADYYILKYAASKPACIVISCNRVKDHHVDGSLQKRIIPVMIIGGEVIFSKKMDAYLGMQESTPVIARKCPASPACQVKIHLEDSGLKWS